MPSYFVQNSSLVVQIMHNMHSQIFISNSLEISTSHSSNIPYYTVQNFHIIYSLFYIEQSTKYSHIQPQTIIPNSLKYSHTQRLLISFSLKYSYYSSSNNHTIYSQIFILFCPKYLYHSLANIPYFQSQNIHMFSPNIHNIQS